MAKAKFSPTYDRLRKSLVDARKNSGLNQADIAKRLGRPQSFMSKVESGERRLDVVEFIELSEAIGADPVKLLRGILPNRRQKP